jgi:hypothetical protein
MGEIYTWAKISPPYKLCQDKEPEKDYHNPGNLIDNRSSHLKIASSMDCY